MRVNNKERTYVPITLAMYEKMERIAIKEGITVELLMRKWIEEKLSEG